MKLRRGRRRARCYRRWLTWVSNRELRYWSRSINWSHWVRWRWQRCIASMVYSTDDLTSRTTRRNRRWNDWNSSSTRSASRWRSWCYKEDTWYTWMRARFTCGRYQVSHGWGQTQCCWCRVTEVGQWRSLAQSARSSVWFTTRFFMEVTTRRHLRSSRESWWRRCEVRQWCTWTTTWCTIVTKYEICSQTEWNNDSCQHTAATWTLSRNCGTSWSKHGGKRWFSTVTAWQRTNR